MNELVSIYQMCINNSISPGNLTKSLFESNEIMCLLAISKLM